MPPAANTTQSENTTEFSDAASICGGVTPMKVNRCLPITKTSSCAVVLLAHRRATWIGSWRGACVTALAYIHSARTYVKGGADSSPDRESLHISVSGRCAQWRHVHRSTWSQEALTMAVTQPGLAVKTLRRATPPSVSSPRRCASGWRRRACSLWRIGSRSVDVATSCSESPRRR